MQASGKMQVGYFTQYQVEELASDDTPLEHMTRAMKGKTPGAVRAQLGRFGFSGNRATTQVGQAVGRRARAAGAGADHPRRAAPADPRRADQPPRRRCARGAGPGAQRVRRRGHPDQPRSPHGRADRRPAGAGRWRHRRRTTPGSIEDYIDFVLGRNQPKADARPKGEKKDRKAAARAREEARQARKEVAEAEAAIARLQAQASSIDRAMFDPASAEPALREADDGRAGPPARGARPRAGTRRAALARRQRTPRGAMPNASGSRRTRASNGKWPSDRCAPGSAYARGRRGTARSMRPCSPRGKRRCRCGITGATGAGSST